MRVHERRSGEKGAVLVMVVLWLPVLILFSMFVMEVGNWFEHKRHLQMQADAGAFAGGDLFNACFGNSTSGSAAIEAEARKYAGDPTQVARYNDQIGGTNQGAVTVRINRKTYEVAGPPPDDTIESPPCDAKMVDVKMTEAGLPWFWRLAFVRAINARARVEVKQEESSSGALPVGVPDNNPLAAVAIFINETTQSILATEALTKVATPPGGLNGDTSAVEWTGAAVPVNISSEANGVVIALSGKAGWTPTGTLSQICGQVLVECYSGLDTGPWTGLNYIRGYSSAGTGSASAPIVRDASLYNFGCSDGSGPYFLLHSGCSVGVRAMIDFGTGNTDPTLASAQGGVGAVVKVATSFANGASTGCPNGGPNPKGCNMVYNTSGANAGYFTTNGSNGYPVVPANGLGNAVSLAWGTTVGTTSRTGTLGSIHRAFSASTASSGPIEYVSVSELGPGANSLAFGSHNLSVTIGVKPSLNRNSNNVNDPPVYLKVVGGSQNQAIDCDPGQGTNLAYELGHGCTPTYRINTGTPCQSYQYYVFPQTADWLCVRTQTGGQNGQVYQGMLDRTQGGSTSCVNPINWADVNGDGTVSIPDDIPAGDPRIVPVFVTPFGSFNGNGNNVIPVINFATFYVTGFSRPGGPGQGDPCPGADAVPAGGGYIVGHFIKYVNTLNTGGGGATCDFNSFGTCVAVLTQ